MSYLTAANADKYDLYTKACQDVAAEVSFVQRIGKSIVGKDICVMREDFCGTAQVATKWVKAGASNRAIAIDHDPEPIGWWQKHLRPTISDDEARRISMQVSDVREPALSREKVDCILALNHSYMVLKNRDLLIKYFQRCRSGLSTGGFLVLDLYGGYHARCPGVADLNSGSQWKAIWRQSEFNPITNEVVNRLDFSFDDGSRINDAFVYEWRLWSTAELSDALTESGFSDVIFFNKRSERNSNIAPSSCVSSDVFDDYELYVVAMRS